MHDQTRTFGKIFVAADSIEVEQALEVRLVDLRISVEDFELSIGVSWQNFQACVAGSASDWHLVSLSTICLE